MNLRIVLITLALLFIFSNISPAEEDARAAARWAHRGDVNYSGMRYKEAIEDYKKALEIYPDNAFFQQRLGDIYVGVGNYDEAKKCYEKAVKLFAESEVKDREKKIRYLKGLIGKLPTSIEDIQKLMDTKSYADVITLCKKRVAMNPGDVTAITYMGIALEESGQWQQAESLYKTAIKRSQEYPSPHFYLARIYLLKRKDADKAIAEIEIFREEIRDLLDKDKQAKEGLIAAEHTLIYIYHEILRDYKTAIRESKYLLELAPDDQEAHYNLALSYAYLDKRAMAYEELKKVIDIDPDTDIAGAAKDTIEYLQSSPSIRFFPYRKIDE